MSARMYVVGALLALLVPTLARAWPVDLVVPLEPGKERFHKLDTVDWVQVADASVADAELLPGSNELLLTGQKAGRTLLLLYAGAASPCGVSRWAHRRRRTPRPGLPRPARPVRI